MNIYEIETPALVLDKKVFEENMDTMDKLISGTGMKLRPHYKSAKCQTIARIQMERGAAGITCAKLSEAEDVAAAGIKNILIANQIVQPSKVAKAAFLAKDNYLIICVDDEDNIRDLSAAASNAGATIHCLVELDVGMVRCGVDTDEEFLELAKLVDSLPGLEFEGIQAYAGNLAHERDLSKREALTEVIEKRVKGLKKLLEDNGLKVKEVGGTSTGTVEQRPEGTVYTHIQTGSYIYMDDAYNHLNLKFNNALFMLATVISAKPDRFITDVGVKSFGMDQTSPYVVGMPEGASLDWSEEHTTVFWKEHGKQMNDKVFYIPGHCCTTVNIFDKMYVIDGEEVVDVWEITGRGKSQ